LRPASSWGCWAAPRASRCGAEGMWRQGRRGRVEQPAIGKTRPCSHALPGTLPLSHMVKTQSLAPPSSTLTAPTRSGGHAFAAPPSAPVAPPSAVAAHDRRVTFRNGCMLAILQAHADSRSFGLRAGRELASLTVCSPCRSPRRPCALAPPQACASRAVTTLTSCPSRRPRSLAANSRSVFAGQKPNPG
jgi:hypothetical protein